MRKADFHLFKITAWFAAFYACANFSALLEAIYRYGAALSSEQILFTGAERLATVNLSINLFSEPVFVYGSLALTFISAIMCGREFIKFSNHLSSLVHGEAFTRTGVNV